MFIFYSYFFQTSDANYNKRKNQNSKTSNSKLNLKIIIHKSFHNRTEVCEMYDENADENLDSVIQILWYITDTFTYWPQAVMLLALAVER